MAHKLITAPTVEPLDATTLKLWCRIDGSDEDTLLTSLFIPAARLACENATGRALITQTWESVLDGWPAASAIELLRAPVIAITSVKYIDTAGVEQTMDSADYALDKDSEPGWLLPAYDTDWPEARDTANAVRVRYTAGYGATAADVPQALRMWIALHAAAAYQSREAASDKPLHINPALDGLLDPYRVLVFR
jgi:uncharacterized phiE125 gp8 family phage protein